MTDLAGKTDTFGDERVTVVFTPSGVTTDVARGTSLLDAARSVGADIDSTCGGRGLCGRCQVTPSIGEFAKWSITSDASAVSPWTTSESDYKGRRRIEPGSRLGCQTNALADVVIDIPPASQVNRPVVRKKIDLPGLTLDPLITARYVELPELELGDERPTSSSSATRSPATGVLTTSPSRAGFSPCCTLRSSKASERSPP